MSSIARMWGYAIAFSMMGLLALTVATASANSLSQNGSTLINPDSKSDEAVCKFAMVLPVWRTEVLRRGITCDGDGNLLSRSTAKPATTPAVTPAATPKTVPEAVAEATPKTVPEAVPEAAETPPVIAASPSRSDDPVATGGTTDKAPPPAVAARQPAAEASPTMALAQQLDDMALCRLATDKKGGLRQSAAFSAFVDEARSRQLTCAIAGTLTAAKPAEPAAAETDLATNAQDQIAPTQPPTATAAVTPPIPAPTPAPEPTIPEITIVSATSVGPQGTVSGQVTDSAGIAELRIDGRLVPLAGNGSFSAQTYVPTGGVTVRIVAVNMRGTSKSLDVQLDRVAAPVSTAIAFDRLNPLGQMAARNKDALALIIGVETYTETPVKAAYANSDASVFADYAAHKLGIPSNRIKTLVDDVADEKGILLTVQDWLYRANRPGKSDIYVFFAGHGLASEDGKDMYLLPHDGSPRLLDRTALLRKELFADIAAANPRSVTVFLDTCYSGTTRGTESLIASRPIAIRAREQAIPDGFTVMTAAGGEQTAKPLEEVKHGMFSYFLMKGMEGGADANNDRQITAGELHAYVQQNVIQQSSGSQTPELQGDADRVLVRFE
ncbi:caspase family protein [Alphaproteobacteria bacterium LSUCC0719]